MFTCVLPWYFASTLLLLTQTFRRTLTASVDTCAKIKCPFSYSGRIWRKVQESDARSVAFTVTPVTNASPYFCPAAGAPRVWLELTFTVASVTNTSPCLCPAVGTPRVWLELTGTDFHGRFSNQHLSVFLFRCRCTTSVAGAATASSSRLATTARGPSASSAATAASTSRPTSSSSTSTARRTPSTTTRTPPTSTRGAATSSWWARATTRRRTCGRTSRPCSTAAPGRGSSPPVLGQVGHLTFR